MRADGSHALLVGVPGLAGKLSTGDIAIILGLSIRFEAEQWLAKHDVCQNYSLDDLEADANTMDRILGPV